MNDYTSFVAEVQTLYEKFKKSLQDSNLGNPDDHFNVLLSKVSTTLEKLVNPDPTNETYFKVSLIKAFLIYEKAKIGIAKNDIESAQELLEIALLLIRRNITNPQISFLHLKIINYLAFVLSKTNQEEKAVELLKKVVENELKEPPTIYNIEDVFNGGNKSDPKELAKKVNKLLINNFEMLASLYNKMNDSQSYCIVEHNLLEKLLEIVETDPVMWSTKCINLANLFIQKEDWIVARYHLVAAETILNRLEQQLNSNPKLNLAIAHLARHWVGYGLELFTSSRNSILEKMCNNPSFSKSLETIASPKSENLLPVPELLFGKINPDIKLMTEIPASVIYTTQQANELFCLGEKWLKRLRLFCTLRDAPNIYINTFLDLSEYYRCLVFYVSHIETQYSIQKKRYDSLETLCKVLKEFRPNSYFFSCIELWKELADVQIEMMGLNLKRIYVTQEKGSDDLKHRMDAVGYIHSKLEALGNQTIFNEGDILDPTMDESGFSISATRHSSDDGLKIV